LTLNVFDHLQKVCVVVRFHSSSLVVERGLMCESPVI
jgi:hypothetical protein